MYEFVCPRATEQNLPSRLSRAGLEQFVAPAKRARSFFVLASAVLGLFTASGPGCATVSAPVLKQETGETLGVKKFRILAHYEMSRIFAPGLPQGGTARKRAQSNSVFQGSYLGVQADGGVLPQLDLQLGANFTASGGGWRVGAKYQFIKSGRFAVSGMMGYAMTSGSGTIQYLTSGTPQEFDQTLSAHTFDFSIPSSVRATSWLVVYGGPMWMHSGASGSFGGLVVDDTFNDFGFNLGLQFSGWIFTGSIEAAELMLNDPFTASTRMVPFVGVSFGVTF